MVNLSINRSTYSRIAAVEPSLQDPLSQPASIEIPGHTPISTHLRGGDGCEYVDMKPPSGFRPSQARTNRKRGSDGAGPGFCATRFVRWKRSCLYWF